MEYKNTFAFCHVPYFCTTCGRAEQVLNSRDGIVPNTIFCPTCGKDMALLVNPETFEPAPDPTFVPSPGRRIIRDGTVDEAWEAITKRMCRWYAITESELLNDTNLVAIAGETMANDFPDGWPIAVEVENVSV